MKRIKLRPSSLPYLAESCPSCTYRELVLGVKKPAPPFPAVFAKIDKAMKKAVTLNLPVLSNLGLELEEVCTVGRKRLSEPIAFPACGVEFIFSGVPDVVGVLRGGEHAIIDLKTSGEAKVQKYALQLYAYAYTLERPFDQQREPPVRVAQLGVLFFHPEAFAFDASGAALLGGQLTLSAFPWGEEQAQAFFAYLLALAEFCAAPEPLINADCELCQYGCRSR